MEDIGWLDVPNKDLLQTAPHLVQVRTAETWIHKVLAHSGIQGNKEANEAAKAGMELQDPVDLTVAIPWNWKVEDTRLATLTFHDIYRWVMKRAQVERSTKAPTITARVIETIRQETGL